MGEWLTGIVDGRPLAVGVIGAGFIGTVHAAAARRAGARVVAVAASSPARSAEAAADLGAERPADDALALIAADDIDVVHICTPNDSHAPLARAALAAGKHVVCEKPLATSVADADELVAAAVTAGRVATVPFAYRFYPMVREARARVGDGFGRPRLIHGTYVQDWLSTPDDTNWRVDVATSGPSRAFADIGSHWCDLVEFVTGDRIAAVCAEFVTAVPERATGEAHAFTTGAGRNGDGPGSRATVDTEDAAVVLFRTRSGVFGSTVISQVSSGHKNHLTFEIAGDTETLAFAQEHPDDLWVGARRANTVVPRDAAGLHPSAAPYVLVPPGHPQGYQECFDLFVADTYRAIAAGDVTAVDGLPSFADGARSARIVAAVVASARHHAWCDVTDAAGPPEPPAEPVRPTAGVTNEERV